MDVSLNIALSGLQQHDTPSSTRRILWAFSRDGALPFSGTLQKVTRTTRVPVYAAVFTSVCCILISLPILGSEVAFTACISMAVVGRPSPVSLIIECSFKLL